MGFWVAEVDALDAYLRAVESDEAALKNLIQVERALEDGVTEDWAINEAVTVDLKGLLLYDGATDAPHTRVEAVQTLLPHIPGEAARRYSSILNKLDGGQWPVTGWTFWNEYEQLQKDPSEYRAHPTTQDLLALPKNWQTVHELQEAGQGHAAIRMGDLLSKPGWPSFKILNRTERLARAKYQREKKRYGKLVALIEFNAHYLDIGTTEKYLRELDTFAPDSTDARTIKGEMPKLRRARKALRLPKYRDQLKLKKPATGPQAHSGEPVGYAIAYLFAAFFFSLFWFAIAGEEYTFSVIPLLCVGPAAWMWYWFVGKISRGEEEAWAWAPVLVGLSVAGMSGTWTGAGMALLLVFQMFRALPDTHRDGQQWRYNQEYRARVLAAAEREMRES